jgi:molybdenum cofactor synthesis domain-containing protein
MVQVIKAALVVIGNEILSGRTHDANTVWIAEVLVKQGITLSEVRIVPDKETKIIEAVNALRGQYDYVFTTGGIGPTHDDITAASIAKAFGVKLERNADAFKLLEQHYGEGNVTKPRAKMAMIPEGAGLIANPVSSAPGFFLENVFVMAGVPRIMQAMFDSVIQKLKKGDVVLSNTVACHLPESLVAEDLAMLQNAYVDVEIGSYPHFRNGQLGLSLVLRSVEEGKLRAATHALGDIIRKHGEEPQLIGQYVDAE